MTPRRPIIKICGVTRLQDALAAAELGADYVGLIRAAGPRAAADGAVAEICRTIPAGTLPVLLYVDAEPEKIAAETGRFGVRHVQLHGAETPDQIAEIASRSPDVALIRAWAIRDAGSVASLGRHLDELRQRGVRLHAVVSDAPKGETPPPDALFAVAAEQCRARGVPVWRAGGLTPENVARVLETSPVGFDGVDVARGVEAGPGVKDAARVRAFVAAVRGTGHCPA